jgi:guanylate kinase
LAGQRLIVLSGPSGSGKATLLSYITSNTGIRRVVTYTTRPPRPSEKDGIDYNFVSKEEFEDLLETGALLEYETVYGDYLYGSPTDIFGDWDGDVVMELDTEGAEKYRHVFPSLVSIFILPPSIRVLIERMDKRHRESNFKERLASARPQITEAHKYDYIVINDDVDRVGKEIIGYLKSGRTDDNRKEKLKLAKSLLSEIDVYR